jgi:hypothetical protein
LFDTILADAGIEVVLNGSEGLDIDAAQDQLRARMDDFEI